jgi:DNA-directed RNA polymerase subunit RPC12/RpoP
MATELDRSAEGGAKVGSDMVRHDYACKKCEKTFVAWSDEARFCPHCRSKRVFKVFLTPTAFNSGTPAKIEKLAEKQLDAMGLSNYTNVGGTPKTTRKTHPTEIAAVAAAKAANVPFDMRAPIRTGPALSPAMPIPGSLRNAVQSFNNTAKGFVTHQPKGPGALVNNLMQRGRQVAPLASRGERIYHANSKEDSAKLKSMMGK